MIDAVPDEITSQLFRSLEIIQLHLESILVAVHLYGSATDGGLKPCSDVDLLVTVSAQINEVTRRALVTDFLVVSAPPGQSKILRALEVTVVVRDDVVPWQYPPMRELQFGEWQRADILANIFEPATVDADLSILLTKARQHGIALIGPSAKDLFDPIPKHDLLRTLADTIDLWYSPQDWEGDEKHVVLTLARIWYSVSIGDIVPKDIAADWVLDRLPDEHRFVLHEARQAYLGGGEYGVGAHAEQLIAFVSFVKREITTLLNDQNYVGT
ncbi:MAG: ANT(3'')-Ia family aminoglycoside nucleotidyltransferase [Cellvibrio sp. 79]|nr:MAG: ANT(3'')-Ia family aminoglycoside nucleotidyltransferase [Cellvibrio sp. 79]